MDKDKMLENLQNQVKEKNFDPMNQEELKKSIKFKEHSEDLKKFKEHLEDLKKTVGEMGCQISYGDFKHREAFCLMIYKCEKCDVNEILWNSRDGVTPFIVSCKDCDGCMQHTHFHLDTRIENFNPCKGMRIFIDLTEQKNYEYTLKRCVDNWDHPSWSHLKEEYKTPEKLAKTDEMEPGSPDVKVV